MKSNDNGKNQNSIIKRLIVLVAVALVAVLGLLVWEFKAYIFPEKSPKESVYIPPFVELPIPEKETFEYFDDDEGGVLFDILDYYPTDIFYGEPLPDVQLIRADGTTTSLQGKYRNKNLVIMFWGSWCPYCKEQLAHAEEFRKVVDAYEDTEFILINKLDTNKEETIAKAKNYLEEKNITFDSYYDEGLEIYSKFGIKLIPTTIILDRAGVVRYMNVEGISSGTQLADAIRGVREGFDSMTLSFIQDKMMAESGLVRINVNPSQYAEHPLGWDSLSESQGLMLEYAIAKEDEALFASTWESAKSMINVKNGLFAWFVTEDGKQAGANAFIDDIRILHMLLLANQKWGGYEEEVKALSDAMLKHCIKAGKPASFYDFAMRASGKSISLCALDFKAFKDLEEIDERWKEVYEVTLQIVIEGMISEEFPLFYSAYSYTTNEYTDYNLNISEALYTYYQLAQAGILPEVCVDWLKKTIKEHQLCAYYSIDGLPVPGYEYESTAAFGLAMLIGEEIDDSELVSLARINMEKTRNENSDSAYYGCFAHEDDASDVNVFDELIPMLAYAKE